MQSFRRFECSACWCRLARAAGGSQKQPHHAVVLHFLLLLLLRGFGGGRPTEIGSDWVAQKDLLGCCPLYSCSSPRECLLLQIGPRAPCECGRANLRHAWKAENIGAAGNLCSPCLAYLASTHLTQQSKMGLISLFSFPCSRVLVFLSSTFDERIRPD